ncbi:type II secretion system protein [Candidatus Margulisiibacteriota bacterium]
MKIKYKIKGFALLELIFVILMISILLAAFFNTLTISLTTLKAGFNTLVLSESDPELNRGLNSALKNPQKILAVSDSGNPQGHLEYLDHRGIKKSLYLNNLENQELFTANNYPKNSLVLMIKNQEIKLVQKEIKEFRIETFSTAPLQLDSLPLKNPSGTTLDQIIGFKLTFLFLDNKKKQYFFSF